ncbi:hypothetical protein [Serratia sp. Je.1.23.a]|uniref:hypothetical protein n=1 Tax=Serratia sp. Je.1.23.a TaxID=3142841 RepID=UPI003DA87381
MADTERNNKKINITELKNAFKEGAIPNEQDYGNLIDLAAVGGRVLGATEEDATALHLGDGLKYVDGKLAILPTPAGGVLVNKEGVSVKVDGNALAATEKGVALRLHQDSGLAVDDNGLHIKAGAGIKADKGGVTVALGPKSGLTVEGNKLAVNLSQTSGLAFDEKGALKVNVNTEEKNNYITSTDKGLAITAEGVTKIKETLKEVSLTALERAVRGTDSGAKDDYKADGEVEAQISQALVNAYKQRSNGKIRTLPAISVLPQLAEKINLKEKLQEELKKKPKGIPEGETFYAFIKGSDDKTLWDSIVKAFTLDGVLHLTQKAGGDIHILGLGTSHDKKGPFPVMVELSLSVATPAVSDKSTFTLDQNAYRAGADMTVNVVLKDKDDKSVTGLKEIMSTSVKVPNSEEGTWSESEPGHYSGVYKAGVHSDENKASLQLPGWADENKKESAKYYIFAAAEVKDVKATSTTVEAGKSLGVSYAFVANGTGADVSTYQWKYRYGTSGDWKAPQSTDAKVLDWVPGVDYAGYQVRLTITPIGAAPPKLPGVPVDGPEISIFVFPKEVSVNGYTFAHDAGFPTTGFRGAQFTLVLNDGKASDYNWESSAAWVKVTDGVVTFTGQGDGNEVTITGKRKEGGSSYIEYKFKLKKWFTNEENTIMTYAEAEALASGHGRMPGISDFLAAHGVRIVKTLVNEWGNLSKYDGGWQLISDKGPLMSSDGAGYWLATVPGGRHRLLVPRESFGINAIDENSEHSRFSFYGRHFVAIVKDL